MACRNIATPTGTPHGYSPNPSHYDEMVCADDNRAHYQSVASWLEQTPLESILNSRNRADAIFRQQGITFTVYGDNAGTERLIPFDIIPRIIPAHHL